MTHPNGELTGTFVTEVRKSCKISCKIYQNDTKATIFTIQTVLQLSLIWYDRCHTLFKSKINPSFKITFIIRNFSFEFMERAFNTNVILLLLLQSRCCFQIYIAIIVFSCLCSAVAIAFQFFKLQKFCVLL